MPCYVKQQREEKAILKNFPALTIPSASEISEQIIAFVLGLFPSSKIKKKQIKLKGKKVNRGDNQGENKDNELFAE